MSLNIFLNQLLLDSTSISSVLPQKSTKLYCTNTKPITIPRKTQTIVANPLFRNLKKIVVTRKCDGGVVPPEEDQYLCLSEVAHKMNTTLLNVCSLEEETFYLASEEDLETIVSILQMETDHVDYCVWSAVQQVYSVDGFNENRHKRINSVSPNSVSSRRRDYCIADCS